MSRKALSLLVDVDIQAVTCPGVWLCPNGRVRLVLSLLGQQVRTRRFPPAFPLLVHEHFVFHKVFSSAGCLSELQSLLGLHDVEALLLQEAEGEPAVQLARFSCSVLHLLFPSPCSKGLLAGVDVDLLMEASADFPGILAPKIELSTRTTVEEVTDYYPSPDFSDAYVINPKTVISRTRCGGRADCHTGEPIVRECRAGLHKKHRSRRASFVEDSRQKYNTNRRASSLPRRISHGSPRGDPEPCLSGESIDRCNVTCPCVIGHIDSRCSLCNRYRAVFHDSASFDPANGTEMNVKSRRCRCPDRHNCAFVRCNRSPQHHRHEAHATRDHHWESSPAAAALRRSHGLALASESSRGQAPVGASNSAAAPPSLQNSLPGDNVPPSPAAAIHDRVERLLQPTADPDNVYKWIGGYGYGRSRTSPIRGPSRRHTSLSSSDESLLSPPSPPPLHLHSRSHPNFSAKLNTEKSPFGHVLRTYPCSCAQSIKSQTPSGKGSFPDVFHPKSCCGDSKISENCLSAQMDLEKVPPEYPEQGDRRVAFYTNLERYYRKLYMRAKERAAKNRFS